MLGKCIYKTDFASQLLHGSPQEAKWSEQKVEIMVTGLYLYTRSLNKEKEWGFNTSQQHHELTPKHNEEWIFLSPGWYMKETNVHIIIYIILWFY